MGPNIWHSIFNHGSDFLNDTHCKLITLLHVGPTVPFLSASQSFAQIKVCKKHTAHHWVKNSSYKTNDRVWILGRGGGFTRPQELLLRIFTGSGFYFTRPESKWEETRINMTTQFHHESKLLFKGTFQNWEETKTVKITDLHKTYTV